MYSMGVDADKHPEDTPPELSTDRCCCGSVRISTAAYLIAFVELIIIFYHLFLALWTHDKTAEDYAFSFILGIFCLTLALVAVILMIIGIRRKSAYFLVPHLLMQFATIVSWTLLAGYLILLMIGGTSIKANVVVYEDSDKGRIGLINIDRRDPIKTQVYMRGLNLLMVALLGLTVFIIGLQIWFFAIIRRCFALLRRKAIDKPSCAINLASLQNDHRV